MISRPLLIFDLDDTIISSFRSYRGLHQRIAGELNWPIPTRDDLVHYGPTWAATLQRLWPGRDLAPFCLRYDEIAHEHPCTAIPGVSQALEQLRASTYSLWIVSKRTRLRLAQRLREAAVDPGLFDGIYTSDEQPAPKPDPRCFDPIWERVGARRRAIYVGDRDEDRRAATDAGLSFVAVRTGPENGEQWLDTLDPNCVIDSAAWFPAWLDENLPRVEESVL
ncbi:MAG: HAD-IA family hydrolase [Nannocystaceae bacterium]